MQKVDGKKCWMFDNCPCRTGVCLVVSTVDETCPVYRWFRDQIKSQEGLFTPGDVSTIMAVKGQSDQRFKLGEKIQYSPSEVQKILEDARKGETDD